MRHITTGAELDTILAEAKNTVVLDIYATWCGPCQRLSPHLDEFERRWHDIVVVKVDVDKVEHGREKDENGKRKNSLLRRFDLKTIPHIRVWKNGKEIYVGDSDHEKLTDVLEKSCEVENE